VRVYDDAALTHQVGAGTFTGDSSFSGTFHTDASTVTVYVVAKAQWSDGFGAGTNGSDTASRPSGCARPMGVSNAGGDVMLGAAGNDLTDTATLSGGLDPTGTITFRLYGDAGCTSEVDGAV